MSRLNLLPLCLLFTLTTALASPTLTDKDLKRLSLGPKDAEVRALMARGEPLAAARLISASSPPARFAKGYLAVEGGDGELALDALLGLHRELPELADQIALLRGRARVSLGKPEAALDDLAAVRPKSPDAPEAKRYYARALREAGQLPAAKKQYEALLSGEGDDVPVALLGLARIYAEQKTPQSALPLLERLDVEFPTHWAAAQGASLAQELTGKKIGPKGLMGDRSAKTQVERAEKLLENRRNGAVVDALTPLSRERLSPELKCHQRYLLGRALRNQRAWKEAVPVLDDAIAACEAVKSDRAGWARYMAGQAAERQDRDQDALAHYRALLEKHPQHQLSDDGAFYVVRKLLEAEDRKGARAVVERLVAKNPAGDMTGEAVFWLTLDALKAGDRARARELLALDQKLPPRDFTDMSGGRAAYWRARLDMDEGKNLKAFNGFQAVMASAPMSWYALMAYSRLYEIDPKRAKGVALAALQGDEARPTLPGGEGETFSFELPKDLSGDRLKRLVLYTRLGLSKLMQAELDLDGNATAERLWLGAWLLDRAGAYTASHNILRRKLTEYRYFGPHGRFHKHWKLAFPRPFAELVEAHAKLNDLPTAFVWAIMREESGYATGAESFANAVGLMQLILPTAKQMAEKADGEITREKLTQPALNIKLGTRYLAFVRKSTGAVTVLLPPGYNAGAGALKRWLKERAEMPLDLFVDSIPFEEARGYIKRVVASYVTFRYLYGTKLKEPLPYISQKIKD